MATIVNTTEEEPTLAVVRFTAELAWADAGPEVAEPEVARLCAEARQLVLAARWLDMVSLMLASADLLLLSPRVPDKDLECVLAIICNLVTKAGSEDEALRIAEAVCTKLVFQQPADNKPALRIKALFGLYNLLASPRGKALVYRKALEVAAAGGGKAAAECVVPSFKNIDAFVGDWGIGKVEQRELFRAVSRILKGHKGMSKEYLNFLNKYLATFDGSGGDADVIGEAKEEAAAAIIQFVKSADLYQCDMLDMPAVAQLEKDEKYQPIYELLKIFLTQRLDSYLEFQSANTTLLQAYGLVHGECVTKMRLMSLLDLSSHCSGEIPYSAITKALGIDEDEVEYWIVKAISSKILDCRVDQLNQFVIVSRHTERIFGIPQWQNLRSKLGVWRVNIANAISTIQANKVPEDGGQGMQGLMVR